MAVAEEPPGAQKKGKSYHTYPNSLWSDQSCQLYHRCRDVTFLYPSLKAHRGLLEQLTPAGMSSDEERTTGQYTQYDVVEPAWRSDLVTTWLRIFDALHSEARRSGVFGNQRGSAPHMRLSNGKISTSGKFIPGLPRNAYDDAWFNTQVHAEDTVQPGPSTEYFHDRRIIE